MAKQSGLGDQLFIGGYDIGGDTSAIGSLATPHTTLDVTGITSSANERIYGLRDATAEFTTFFNPGPVGGPLAGEHLALRALPYADTQVMYLHGQAIGSDAFCMTGKQINYDPNRGTDGSLAFGVNAQSNGFGADWSVQLTAGKRSDTTATNGAALDTLAAAAFGFQAHLQVFSFTGTSVVIKIQDSPDNITFTDVVGGTFTTVSAAPTFERIQSASATLSVARYLRVITTGTFSQCKFVVAINKNEAARVL